MKIDVYNQAGKKVGSKDLDKEIFGAKINEELMHQMLTRQLSNARNNIAKVKERGEVRGGGKKPYRQKGTGRARQGTIRAPQMRGGAVIFGPSGERNFIKNMPKKQRRAALFSALSQKAKENAVFALDTFQGEISTKGFVEMIKKLPVERNVLLVIPEKNSTLELSARNIPTVKTVLAGYVNIADLLKFSKLCLVGDADKKIREVFLETKKVEK